MNCSHTLKFSKCCNIYQQNRDVDPFLTSFFDYSKLWHSILWPFGLRPYCFSCTKFYILVQKFCSFVVILFSWLIIFPFNAADLFEQGCGNSDFCPFEVFKVTTAPLKVAIVFMIWFISYQIAFLSSRKGYLNLIWNMIIMLSAQWRMQWWNLLPVSCHLCLVGFSLRRVMERSHRMLIYSG